MVRFIVDKYDFFPYRDDTHEGQWQKKWRHTCVMQDTGESWSTDPTHAREVFIYFVQDLRQREERVGKRLD